MGIGGAITTRHEEEMKFTPIVRENGMYSVRVLQVWLGDVCLVSDAVAPKLVKAFSKGKGTLLDSGTTDTFLPKELAESFAREWERLTGMSFSQRATRYSYKDFVQLPTLEFYLEGEARILVPPLHYMEGAMVDKWQGTRELTNRIYVDEAEGAVLGLNAQTGSAIKSDTEAVRYG